MKTHLVAVGAIIAFAALLGGSYYVIQSQVVGTLEKKATEALVSGDYLASLRHLEDLRESAPKEASLRSVDEKITEAKNLLLADEILTKARTAAENGDWFQVKALLQQGDATTNTSFTHYKEAIDLYVAAANKVRELEEKIDAELSQFREEALTEKTKRQAAEQKVTQTTQQLETTVAEKQASEQKLQQEISIVSAEKDVAERMAEQERLSKFLNEIDLYLSMLGRGVRYLDDAIVEIDEGKDTTALALLNQGKALFDEVSMRTNELLVNRTENAYKPQVTNLLQAATVLVSAARSFGSAVFYIDQKDGDEFQKFMSDGRQSRAASVKLMDDLRAFILSLR
ncbi:MAG: hypothetical protein HYS74_01000 [Parcubacteria group bacterium]|nr:hypothetical protein [Parcubacteria group bacterium]